MALKTCSDCVREVNSKDWVCPHCGSPLEQPPEDRHEEPRWARGMLVFLLVVIALAAIRILFHIIMGFLAGAGYFISLLL